MSYTIILGHQFGWKLNTQGYKVLHPSVRIIQGDGINEHSIEKILSTLKEAGWSADNIAFGMGGALLQHMNRDTLKFAMKASAVMIDYHWRDVFKNPVTDPGKVSKKGLVQTVLRNGEYKSVNALLESTDGTVMRDVYSNGQLLIDEDLKTIRARSEA